jgi:hypothetical protein
MKLLRLVSVSVVVLFLAAFACGQSMDEPRFVNRLLGDFQPPVITPGDSGVFSFSLNNPDPVNLTQDMQNVRLNISIYQYATLEESMMIWEIDEPPIILESGDIEYEVEVASIPPGGQHQVSFTIFLDSDTPHGSFFSQSTYFLRFWLEFGYGASNYTFASKGYFSDKQWTLLTSSTDGVGAVDQAYLEQLGLDGVIPDSGFAAKPYADRPLPIWPFYLLVFLTALVGALAVAFFTLDNPGRFPGLEKPLLRINGQLIKLRRTRFKRKRG